MFAFARIILKGGSMIYVMQPVWYNKNFYRTIKEILAEHYPNRAIKHKSFYRLIPNHKTPNTYFIINDVHLKTWNGIKIAKQIRSKEPHSNLILISNDLDYQKMYRTHLCFLGILNLSQLDHAELASYVHDIASHQ